ncbi:GIY-YIG nuclease family protein [Lactobacillus johnsonii]|uniref:GIY-YIG nuclease family protein n=1 Tax=Lactobacillus johnsonii TaxID=33959 RepID=UPI00107E801A|nr:GIY-YIG nuclease family protein [Lactobacillus johnsonii]TGA93825.1 GIY-YIG nuclease family protein [Lactobacillus johnsonii]
MNSYFLYKHTNQINGKVYIGITNDISRRWRNQGIEYKPHSSNTSRFWNAIQKYGWNNFKHEILINNLTSQEACKKEIEYIAKYDSTNHLKGYNIASGGNGGRIWKEHPRGMLGKHQTEHHRLVMSKQVGNKNPNSKGLKVIFPNNTIRTWPTMKAFVDEYGFYKVYELVKSGKPYNVDLRKIKKKDREKCSYFMGCIFKHQ